MSITVCAGPIFASNPVSSAAECCKRCDRAGNACIAWWYHGSMCNMMDSFDPTAVHVMEGATYGQLRQSTNVFNPTPSTPPQGARPVILIVADDMRPSLPMYGLKEGYAPNLAKLAETGTMWRHAYVQVRGGKPGWSLMMVLRRYRDLLRRFFYKCGFDGFCGLQYSYCAPRLVSRCPDRCRKLRACVTH